MATAIVLITFFAMEAITWFTHKYVMHGFLWGLHADHHRKYTKGFFEKNDLFFVIFAIPSIFLFIVGHFGHNQICTAIALGICLYGFAYFVVHEIIIHQRFKFFTRSNNIYIVAIRKAHKTHHKHLDKENGECFGMLYVPYKFFIDAFKAHNK